MIAPNASPSPARCRARASRPGPRRPWRRAPRRPRRTRRGDDVDRELDRERERVVLAHLLGHLAADQHAVGAAAEVLEHGELVVDLGAAGDEHERALDLAEQPAEVVELREQQQPRVGRQQMRDRLGRAVRAVGRAERVVDVEIVAVGELARVPLVVLRLTGVEARVLEHAQPVVRDELAQAALDRSDRVLLPVLLGLRPPEVRADGDGGRTAVEQQLEGRDRGPDPGVVGDLAAVERDVEVGADENALPSTSAVSTERGSLISEAACPSDRRAGSCSPTRCRTTRRPSRCARGPSSARRRRCTSTASP